MAEKKASDRFRRKRSGILYLISVLIVVVFVIASLAIVFLFRGSQGRLIDNSEEKMNILVDKSIDKMVESEVQNLASASAYITELLLPVFEEKISGATPQELIHALLNRELTEGQRFVNEELSKMIENGLFGLEKVFIFMPPSPINTDAIVIAASDQDLIYGWEVPEEFTDALDEGLPYVYYEDGIPSLGLSGPHAVIINEAIDPNSNVQVGYAFVKPMEDEITTFNAFYNQEIDDIRDFYEHERSRTDVLLWVTMAVSIVVVVIITFFVLSYLIRKRITEPIDTLAAYAEEVMRGNLDVEVTVHEGGEFEGLERAFKEMVESIRTFIARSVGEE